MKALAAIAFLLGLGLLAGLEPAWAKDAPVTESSFRDWWDLAWRIINFLVLAGLIYKLAKKPMKDFLSGQRDMVAADLEKVQKAKENAAAERAELEEKIKSMAENLAQYEKNLEELAQRQSEEIMEEARNESSLILDRAELWAGQALKRARKDLADEILEMAADMAGIKSSRPSATRTAKSCSRNSPWAWSKEKPANRPTGAELIGKTTREGSSRGWNSQPGGRRGRPGPAKRGPGSRAGYARTRMKTISRKTRPAGVNPGGSFICAYPVRSASHPARSLWPITWAGPCAGGIWGRPKPPGRPSGFSGL